MSNGGSGALCEEIAGTLIYMCVAGDRSWRLMFRNAIVATGTQAGQLIWALWKGWKIEERHAVDFASRELIHAGRSGSTIEISYRELRGGWAAPAFFQNLKYDLSESSVMRFQRFQLRRMQCRFRLLSSRTFHRRPR